jgi:hypothetical protein
MHSNQSWFFRFFGGLEHQPSPRGWAESSPFICFGLEHQPSPRDWAESTLVAGTIQARPSPFHFFFFFCCVCFFYYYIYIFENYDFPTDFSMSF